MKTVIKLAIIAAGLALGSIFGPPAARASGDAPWCAITEVGDGDGQWDCQYETVQECIPHVQAGNRGQCTPNPHAADPAPVSAPATSPITTAPGTAQNRKVQEHAK